MIQRKDIERALKELETIEQEKSENLEQERHEIKRFIEESKRALSDLHLKQKIFEERLDRQDNTCSNSTSDFRVLESLQSSSSSIHSKNRMFRS